MSISIHIDAHPEHGDVANQINEAMAALGFIRATDMLAQMLTEKPPAGTYASEELISSTGTVNEKQPPVDNEHVAPGAQQFTADEIAANNVTRIPGQPSPGAKRRTKAEIAEDEAAAVLAASQRVAAVKADVLADAAAAADSAEDVAQDAADEAAEAAASKTGLTHDDLRQAVGRYQKKFGMAAAVAGVPTLLGCALIDVPEADLAAAIAKIDNAVAGDAPGAIEEKVAEVKAATKEDVMAAMLRYALKFDKQNTDMTAMPFAMADCPAIFKLLFGEGVEKLSQVPVEGYAETISAIDEAIAKNPFKR